MTDNLFQGTQATSLPPQGIRRIQRIEIPKGTITLNELQQGTSTIFFGLDADLPDDGSVAPAFYARDTNRLYLWDGSQYTIH